MTHSPARVIAAWLVAHVHAYDPPAAQWGCYVSSLPDGGHNALCVYDTVGILQGRIQRTGETIETPGIQVRVRSQDYETGRAKADALCAAFDELFRHEVEVDDTDYLIQAVTRTTPVICLGPEEGNKRERFTINFLVTITELP